MGKNNFACLMISLSVLLVVGMGCNALSALSKGDNNSAPANTAQTNSAAPSNSSTSSNSATSTSTSAAEPADFTMTSEQLDKEYTRKGVTDADLQKYASKNIAVTGRVSMLVTEKKGTTQPWVTLFAPGLGHGVNCYFDDENVGQMSMLKDDKMAKVQGFQDDFIVPEISPMLKHCVVLEGSK